MKKATIYTRVIVFVAVIIFSASAALLSSCASAPSPDTGEGTLLTVPALYFSNAPVDLQTSIYHNVSIYNLDTDTEYIIRFPSYKGDDYILINFLPAGTYRFTGYESKGFSEPFHATLNVPIDFQIKKGEITIPPYKWVSRIDENPKTKHHTYFFDWIILTDDQRERMMDIFRNNPKFAAWIKGAM